MGDGLMPMAVWSQSGKWPEDDFSIIMLFKLAQVVGGVF
jgi:hypothetical protein